MQRKKRLEYVVSVCVRVFGWVKGGGVVMGGEVILAGWTFFF